MKNNIILEMLDVTKQFKGIVALQDAKFELRKGEIHTLLGENGAGKSTILNIMSGSLQMDSGELRFEGKKVEIGTPQAAKTMGIIKVHQELQIVPEMKVYENVFLGSEKINPLSRGLQFKAMRRRTKELLQELDADFSSDEIVKNLSIAQQQLVEIAKALLNDFSVLILDEPTSSLTTREIKKLFEIMRQLKARGKAIIFVSHRLEEVFEISDRITIFRDGRYIDTLIECTASRENLIRLMTGRDLSQGIKNTLAVDRSEVVLTVRNLESINERFHEINFDLYKGEVLGFAGLVGSGRTEIMRAIFGADKLKSGDILIHNKNVKFLGTRASTKRGLAFIPEDRKNQGMVGLLTNMNNIGLGSYRKLTKMGVLLDRSILKNAESYMKKINVRPMQPKLKTENLSGGNQQKVVIAKWLSVNADIIIMDEPTRGIDVGAKEEIHKLMLELVKNGVSIILISSELPEVISMSNRIIVMYEGRMTGELSGDEVTEAKILNYAMGGNDS